MGGVIDGFKGLIYITGLSLDTHSASIQRPLQLNATITPSNATNQNLVWSSSDTSIATVSSSGLVTPTGEGDCIITCTLDNFSDTCSISASPVRVEGVSLNKSSATILPDEPLQLVATISPSDAVNKNVTRTSSNSSIASVSNTGYVTFVAEGNCTITVTTEDGGYTATCSITCEDVRPVTQVFTYTGADQQYTIPYTQCYKLEARGAGGRSAKGGYASGIMCITKGTVYKIMVGATGCNGNGTKYGFGGSANGGSNAAGGGLSGIFTGSAAIAATDSSRAVVIGGGAGGNSAGTGGAGGGETGGTGTGSYGTAGGGATQSGHGSSGNSGGAQFCGGNGSGTYGYGGGGGWRGGNGSKGDSSADDDKGGGGGSGYVLSSMTSRTLTQGGGMAAGCNGCVKISSI